MKYPAGRVWGRKRNEQEGWKLEGKGVNLPATSPIPLSYLQDGRLPVCKDFLQDIFNMAPFSFPLSSVFNPLAVTCPG